MKKQRFFFAVLVCALLPVMSGCARGARESEMKARFCADNEILTYQPVDFEKTVITIGMYAPGNANHWSLPLKPNFLMLTSSPWKRSVF